MDAAQQKFQEAPSQLVEMKNSLDPKVLKIVSTVALVGTMFYTRKIFKVNKKALKVAQHSLEFSHQVVHGMDASVVNLANIITELKNAGTPFEFFPGVGVWASK